MIFVHLTLVLESVSSSVGKVIFFKTIGLVNAICANQVLAAIILVLKEVQFGPIKPNSFESLPYIVKKLAG